MKKRQLKIKFTLFIILAVILGMLLGLFARYGKGYSTVEIFPETTTEPTAEAPTEPITEEPTAESVPESEIPEVSEPSGTPLIDWASYSPAENLMGENWALTLISLTYRLDKSYTPMLAPVIDASSVTADQRVSEAYRQMYADAQAQGIVLTPQMGYCSIQRQQTNYDNKLNSFLLQGMSPEEAKSETEKRIAPGGCSETNAGLSVDIVSISAGFASTPEYNWLTENAHKYGFVLRYPDGKQSVTGMTFQPWHWRFVGTEAAAEMKAGNLCLEEYLTTLTKPEESTTEPTTGLS